MVRSIDRPRNNLGPRLALLFLLGLSGCGGGGDSGGSDTTPPEDNGTAPPENNSTTTPENNVPPSENNTPTPAQGSRINVLYSPLRIAEGPDGRLFVTDSKSESLFILKNMLTEGEIQGLAKPLGVAVDSAGNIYVGNDGYDNVVVYDTSGKKQREIGTGTIQMPNDLALDLDGNLYVADSLANNIKVYDQNGELQRTIGDGTLHFPTSLCIAYNVPGGGSGELYVADQWHGKVQVFNLSGDFLRSYGTKMSIDSTEWQGRFVQLQGLAVDQAGHLHALDSSLSRVQILDATNGAYIDSYGSRGAAEGQLYLPLDILVTADNQVMVTNYGNHRVDMVRDMNR